VFYFVVVREAARLDSLRSGKAGRGYGNYNRRLNATMNEAIEFFLKFSRAVNSTKLLT
jgi:hypothetical protein